MARFLQRFCLIATLLACQGCGLFAAQTPDLLVNEKFTVTSQEERQSDIRACIERADHFVITKNRYGIIAKRTLLGTLAGTATGAISGSIVGDTPKNVAAGAAVGTVVGFIQALLDLSERAPRYERFTEHCLQQKGYEIIGWSEK